MKYPSKTIVYSSALIALTAILTIHSCKDKEQIDPIDERQSIIDDYTNNYLGSAVTTSEWTGNTASCNAGSVPESVHNKVLQRINYFRRQVGLNDDITLDTSKNRKCQEAALMMMSNGTLNHTPPTTWKCYTADGAAAAGASNLSSGNHSVNAITGQMADNGSTNQAAGHRRWILYSKALKMGHGSTSNYQALWVIGAASPTLPPNMPEYVCWPPNNYVPAPLVFNRWTFSIPGADFTNTTVNMTDASGKPVNLTIVHFNGSYGDRTVVWEPTGIVTNANTDVTYTVQIKDVKLTDGTIKMYSYKVTIIKV